MTIPIWLNAEEVYLTTLRDTCDELRGEYLYLYNLNKNRLYQLKLPAIVMSSVSGFVSFGSANFDTRIQTINIATGVIGLTVAILNTIESFFGLNTTMVSAKATSLALQMLSQKITLELSLDVCDRSMNGILFLRDSFNEFEMILKEAVPIYKAKQAQDKILQMNKRMSSSDVSSLGSPDKKYRMILNIDNV
jgi:hypothetical protein